MNSMQFMDWSYTTWSGNGFTNHCVNYRGQAGYKFSSQSWTRGEVNITRRFSNPTFYGRRSQLTTCPLYNGYGRTYAPSNVRTSPSPYALINSTSVARSTTTTPAISSHLTSSVANSFTVGGPVYSTPNSSSAVLPFYLHTNPVTSVPYPTRAAIAYHPTSSTTATIPSSTIETPPTTESSSIPNTSEYTPSYIPTVFNPASFAPIPTSNTIVHAPTSTINFAPTYVEGYEPTHLAGYIPAQLTGYTPSQVSGYGYTPMLVNQVYYGNVPVYAYQPIQEMEIVPEEGEETPSYEEDIEEEEEEVENSDENYNNEEYEHTDASDSTENVEVKDNLKKKIKEEDDEKVPENKTQEENASGEESGTKEVVSIEENHEILPHVENIDSVTFNERYPHYNLTSLPFYEGVNYVALPYAGNNHVPLPNNQHFEDIEHREEAMEEEDGYEYTLGDFPLLNMPEF